ncbi:MAG: Ig-like domain-containing protein [Gemmatimonadetes bacterium]|nr:Ig-like domain-containing protein [Gemmatimonadota bacterium]
MGTSVQASAVVYDASGHVLPNAIVTWTSSERAVATVSEVGLVQAIAPGRAQIRATIKNINGADSVIVLAPAPKAIVSLTLSLGDSSLVVGETASATATVRDSSGAVVTGQSVAWSVDSGNTAATVSASGLVTAIAPGTAVIRGTVGALSSTVLLTVSAPPPPRALASVTVTVPVAALQVGETTVATAIGKDSAGVVITGETFAWSVDSGATVLSISTAGVITAVAPGTAIIRASSRGASDTAAITVAAPRAPPTVSPTSIPLVVTRLVPGAGVVLVSNAIPLVPGALPPTGLASVKLTINNVEIPIAAAATAGSHKDGSLRSVVVQFLYDVPTSGAAALLELGQPRTADIPPQAIPGIPIAVALPTDPNYLIATEVVGPTTSVAQNKALGGAYLKYETDWAANAEKHWATYGYDWAATNYYDRAQIYYAWWVRTGNPEYWRRGTLTAMDYRTKYLEPNKYGASLYWSQLEGIAAHYRLTGDPHSQVAVGKTADILGSYYRTGSLGNINHGDMESRGQARSLQAFLLAWEIQAPGGANYTPSSWSTHLPLMLTQILKAQQPSGAFLWNGWCGTSLNYMNGLLNDVMIRYFQRFQADGRILTSVKANADWLWATQWRPTGGSFNYQSAYCARNNSGPSASGDLNLLYVTTYSWLAQQTGNTAYRTTADLIFTEGVRQTYLAGTKQFNEAFTLSYKYFALRP